MSPYIIDTIVDAIKNSPAIDMVPMDHYAVLVVAVCQCHGATGAMTSLPLEAAPPEISARLRADRTETSLPVVVTDQDAKIVRVAVIHWDEPRPAVAAKTTPAQHVQAAPALTTIRVNSRGGAA
jgi:hypothetical protein